jgi:hypothetical protein
VLRRTFADFAKKIKMFGVLMHVVSTVLARCAATTPSPIDASRRLRAIARFFS